MYIRFLYTNLKYQLVAVKQINAVGWAMLLVGEPDQTTI